VPHELRTLVVVPMLLTSASDVEENVQNLEVHHLATQEDEVQFALLSDWSDSKTENARDAELLRAAEDGIARLNRIHGFWKTATASCCCIAASMERIGRRVDGWERSAQTAGIELMLRGSSNTRFHE